MRSRWWFPVVVLPSLLIGAPASAQPAVPGSIGPAAAAWFDAGYPTATAPKPPAPTGVGSDQLLVEGATVATSMAPAPLPVAPVVAERALTALAFRIPQGATAATLVLDLVPGASTAPVTGKAPTGVTPQACPATGAFEPGGQQPFDALPEHDCSGRTSVGALSSDGTQLVFADIGGLAGGSTLSVVLRPGTLGPERLVIDTPSRAALTLLPFDAAPAFDGSGKPVAPPPAAPVALADAPSGSTPPPPTPDGTGDSAAPALPGAAPAPAPAHLPLVEPGAPEPAVAVRPAASSRAGD
ncbi:MAG: hypothetical protein JWM62_2713, partial [Frankiales bacterium]|nr:hypothetical protein [Frankiales bacterium]